MGMKQHEEVGLTLVATPVLREAVSRLEDMMELAAADMLMEPKGTEYNSDLWLLIGKLRGSLHTPNATHDGRAIGRTVDGIVGGF